MTLVLPPAARGLILLPCDARGANRAVTRRLLGSGFATYLIDLDESQEVSVLADRLAAAVARLAADAQTGDLPPTAGRLPRGCFASGAAGTGALRAAAMAPDRIQAVVARHGARVTLCAHGAHLGRVRVADDAAEHLAALACSWFALHLALRAADASPMHEGSRRGAGRP